jgi:predicted oxidoreductase
MKTYAIPRTDLEVTRIAYGCMPLGGGWDDTPLDGATREKAGAALHAAIDHGITFFDHADIYCRGKSERVFGDALKQTPGLRAKMHVQSKCGIRFPGTPHPDSPQRFDFSHTHIVQSVEGSLKRLGTDYLDTLLLHRPDPLVEPEEVARAFDDLHTAGKVRYFGVSNHTAAQISLLRKYVRQPNVFNQVAFNLLHTGMLDEGVVYNQITPRAPERNHGTIEYCREHDITLQAWNPLISGRLTGGARAPLSEAETHAAVVLADTARARGVSPEAILIAWVLRHPAKIQPIIGSTNPARIAASCEGDTVELSREEWYRLYIAGRGERLP